MTRACTLVLPILVMLARVPAVALSPADLPASSGVMTVSGSYFVTFNMRLGTPLPAGGALLCRAYLAPALGGYPNPGGGIPQQEIRGLATVRGALATCRVQVPFQWQQNEARDDAGLRRLTLNYEIDAIDGPGAQPYPVRTQQWVGVPYPASNSKESLQIDVLL